ncbi:ornithine cyclodeaminase family protein [Micromonospora sp. DR5-3]|uniref:ornithine cyclodeaminase family protein n=1 Tax=unclassified Micromonospora TaxID=2617518 RepID=UPI0021038B2F|nr:MULTISPECIES: ornithine cyclodeaminase family protein [unclassified Micromonospora]MCW3816338.1 ornithine cyclodeaminase family protein [Micromonospora sp. DR5-3]
MTEPTGSFGGLRLISGAAVAEVPIRVAVDALAAALREGLDPERETPRSRVATQAGELLVMPATRGGYTGCKLLTSTPDNAGRGLPLIQGAFVLFEGPGQRPAALIDGTALTNLRTPAVSALAVRYLLPATAGAPLRLTVFGTGPQARAHVAAMLALYEISEVALVGRDGPRRERLAAWCDSRGVPARLFDPGSCTEAVTRADLICCCTSAATPLFDGALVKADAVVVAIGSHSPHHREVDDTLVARSRVVVESLAGTRREAGDIVSPLSAGVVRAEDLYPLRDLVTGRTRLPAGGPRLFKGVGMPWQDLVVGVEIYRAHVAGRSPARPAGLAPDVTEADRPPPASGGITGSW